MQGRDRRADAELPLETKPDVDQDRAEGEHCGEHAGPDQFTADARPDDFGAAVLDAGAERLAHL